MVTTTYLVLVVGVAAALCVAWVRRSRAHDAGGRPSGGPTRVSLRALLLGTLGPAPDLVERMADALVERTTMFGSSYAIPGHIGAILPRGLYEAATAVREQLTDEVLERFRDTMTERARRLGRAEFVLPERYVLRLDLARGTEQSVLASFDPIDDVHAAIAQAGRDLPAAPRLHAAPRPRAVLDATAPVVPAGRADVTRLRVPAPHASPTVLLSIDGVPHARSRLDDSVTALSIGRGEGADLRCPVHLSDVSRTHAELTWVDGRAYVQDTDSANGTWVQRHAGGDPTRLVAGEPVALSTGDTVWLDADHQATVTML